FGNRRGRYRALIRGRRRPAAARGWARRAPAVVVAGLVSFSRAAIEDRSEAPFVRFNRCDRRRLSTWTPAKSHALRRELGAGRHIPGTAKEISRKPLPPVPIACEARPAGPTIRSSVGGSG